MLKIGDQAPDFTLASTGGKSFRLEDFKGNKLILYFYPKDDTPGCTTEACDFRDSFERLLSMGVRILGISKNSLKDHEKFLVKYELPFPLGSDESSDVCESYGVWIEKSMYGKKYMGIERSTFLIDETGKIQKIWQGVKVPGHVDEVIAAL